nr:hypothetical protein Iba_chr11aCG6450 [Ipomoea batatas]
MLSKTPITSPVSGLLPVTLNVIFPVEDAAFLMFSFATLRFSGGDELFDGEEEGHALAAGELDGDGGVVYAVFLLEFDAAVGGNLEGALDFVERVGQARHELGVLEFRRRVLAHALGLHCEGGWLQAELLGAVLAWLECELVHASFNGGTLVSSAAPLHLHIRLALNLIEDEEGGSGKGETGEFGSVGELVSQVFNLRLERASDPGWRRVDAEGLADGLVRAADSGAHADLARLHQGCSCL